MQLAKVMHKLQGMLVFCIDCASKLKRAKGVVLLCVQIVSAEPNVASSCLLALLVGCPEFLLVSFALSAYLWRQDLASGENQRLQCPLHLFPDPAWHHLQTMHIQNKLSDVTLILRQPQLVKECASEALFLRHYF